MERTGSGRPLFAVDDDDDDNEINSHSESSIWTTRSSSSSGSSSEGDINSSSSSSVSSSSVSSSSSSHNEENDGDTKTSTPLSRNDRLEGLSAVTVAMHAIAVRRRLGDTIEVRVRKSPFHESTKRGTKKGSKVPKGSSFPSSLLIQYTLDCARHCMTLVASKAHSKRSKHSKRSSRPCCLLASLRSLLRHTLKSTRNTMLRSLQCIRNGHFSFSTCLFIGSVALWLIVFAYASILRTAATTTALSDYNVQNLQTLQTQYMTIHERSQVRRQQRLQRRQHRKRTRQTAQGDSSAKVSGTGGWAMIWNWEFWRYPTDSRFADSTSQTKTRQRVAPVAPNQRKGNSEALPKDCVRPDWQEFNFPTCNDVHDIDLAAILSRRSDPTKPTDQPPAVVTTGFLASGLWRSVWAVNPRASTPPPHEVVVLKMMRREHDVTPRNVDRHRRDALVMERLAASPYVVDAYAYCTNSVVTEYLDSTLEDFIFDATASLVVPTDNNQKADNSSFTMTMIETNISATHRLQWALDVARGIQALHEMPGGPVVHADLQPKQFLVSATTGIVKVNDFNRCRFMATKQTKAGGDLVLMGAELANNTTVSKYSTRQNQTSYCSFRIPTAPGKMRAPEEYSYKALDEKMDMYSVANILYSIFTQQDAWFDFNERDAKSKIQDGYMPEIIVRLPDATMTTQTQLRALIQRAYALEPTNRISASELASTLERLLEKHLNDRT